MITAWQRTVDRRRISDYAKLLEIAWQKSDYEESVTDAKGRLLPKCFSEEILRHGGIHRFSRQPSKTEPEVLKASGYKQKETIKIEWAKAAIEEGTFVRNDKSINIINSSSVPCGSTSFAENEPVLLLGRYNKNKGEVEISFIPQETRARELFEHPMKQALIAFYDLLNL